MRLLPKREVDASRRREEEEGIVRSVRISDVFAREKRALADFRERRTELMAEAERDLAEATAAMAEERRKAETGLHYAKERRDAVMPALEALSDSLETARKIVESEREANLEESSRLARVAASLDERTVRAAARKSAMDAQSSGLHGSIELASARILEATKAERKNASAARALARKEAKLMRDVERDRKLMVAHVSELSIRNSLLDGRERKVNDAMRRVEHSQKTLRIAREQFLKEKSHYG